MGLPVPKPLNCESQAKSVAQLLRRSGLTVWLELDELNPGQPWLPQLEAALAKSTHFVVLVGATGVRKWVEREVRFALERNTREDSYSIVPLLLPDAVESDLPLFLKQHQFLRLESLTPAAESIQRVAGGILHVPSERVSILPDLPDNPHSGDYLPSRRRTRSSSLGVIRRPRTW